MSEHFSGNKDSDKAQRAAKLKSIIDRLAAGATPAAVKKEFHELIKNADAVEVAALEQSLIEAGTPVEEVQRLCEVHADVFKAGLEKGERPDRMPGHPVHTYISENREASKRLRALRWAILGAPLVTLQTRVNDLRPIIVHYERKENQLFPFLERAGFTGPSKVMWGKHDEIRQVFRDLDTAFSAQNLGQARRLARDLARRLRMMIFMEERILFPNALKRLSDADWASVRRGEDAIGFAWIRPGASWDPALVGKADGGGQYSNFNAFLAEAQAAPASTASTSPSSQDLPLSVGHLPLDYLDRILKSLPIDISFVDADDKVMYYSDSPHRVFPRSPGIIGRSVQNCHPHKSVATVEKILEAFRKKEKDKADFWIQMGERFIVISYKPLYDDTGKYLGTLEMSWDATEVRALDGQRRLLDW